MKQLLALILPFLLVLPLTATAEPAQKKEDAKHRKTGKAQPVKDPALARHYLHAGSPRPGAAEPVPTTLPLEVAPGTRIALIGNLLLDTERRQGHLEALLHQRFPTHQLVVRNFSWPADEVALRPRPKNFADLHQHLFHHKTDLIIAAFGSNESFGGKAGLSAFKGGLDAFLSDFTSKAYNGKSAARLVLVSPTAHENVPAVAAADRNNANLALYTAAMREAARRHKVGFVDVLTETTAAFAAEDSQFTLDGNALNEDGHRSFAQAFHRGLFGETPPEVNEDIRALVKDKAFQYFHRYRPLNSYYYTGSRNKSHGYLDFLPAMRNFEIMTANRDKAIWSTAQGKPAKPDDANLPPMDEVHESRGANEWLSPADEQAAFIVDPRFEVNCFASEEDFPELACPIQMRWDAKGRLWVSCSTTYPHLYPGNKPNDKIIILEDTDGDGKADKCTTWADDLHIPLSFVLDDQGGVYVSEEPHLTYLRDTDGDDRADTREIIFTGFGCEDSHHALHDFTWTPAGDLLFRESIFHNSQVETAYGPLRAKNSSWFLYNPGTRKLDAFGAYPNTNPWGVTFDRWGNHVASHPVFASSFHAKNPPYPDQHPKANQMQAYSGVCGHDFVDDPRWPKELQGGFLKVRYKPTNRVEIHRWIEEDDHFREEYVSDLIFSQNLSFIPVDAQFGPRGAFYICDWYNPVKGHAQYSLRDPRRDRKSGRIWRVVPKGMKLHEAPKLARASSSELTAHLASPRDNVRAWARRQLRARGETTTPQASASEAELLEHLWLSQGLDQPDTALLEKLAGSKDHLLAAAAYAVLRLAHEKLGAERTKALLDQGARHASQHVRRETILTASWVGSRAALEAVLPVLDQPMGVHLRYATVTALGSENLSRHWRGSSHEKRVAEFLGRAQAKDPNPKDRRSRKEIAFDTQKGLQVVEIGCVPERLLFDRESFTVKAGKPVKLTLTNPDATQHNLVILKRGASLEEIGMAANRMAQSPEGAKLHFIPNDKRILHHTKLIDPGESETLRFTAPRQPGKYPYVCTFPGHWIVMKGVMVVE